MTAHSPERLIADASADYKASLGFHQWRQAELANSLGAAAMRCAEIDRPATVAVLSALIEDMGAGIPETPLLNSVRSEALFWADCASPVEIEAYTAAGLRAIDRGAFHVAARKRLLIALWNSLTAADKRGFLAHANKAGGDA